jgi:hypothetical protein
VNRRLLLSCRIQLYAASIEHVTAWLQVSHELYPNESGGTDLISQRSCASDTDLLLSLRAGCGLKVTGACMENIHERDDGHVYLWYCTYDLEGPASKLEASNCEIIYLAQNSCLGACGLCKGCGIPCLSNFHYRCHKRQPPGFVKSLMNTAHTSTQSVFEIHFNHIITRDF